MNKWFIIQSSLQIIIRLNSHHWPPVRTLHTLFWCLFHILSPYELVFLRYCRFHLSIFWKCATQQQVFYVLAECNTNRSPAPPSHFTILKSFQGNVLDDTLPCCILSLCFAVSVRKLLTWAEKCHFQKVSELCKLFFFLFSFFNFAV